MYLEGSDQHRGWFQSSLLLSLAGNGAAPYRTVLTHGFMVDADRQKISKSKQGAYVKPQTAEAYIGSHGADVVRLWVSSQDFRNDVVVSEDRLKKVSESYKMIRNGLRYQLSNLFDFDPSKDQVEDNNLTGLDRWMLAEFSALEQRVATAYDNFDFHVVYQQVTQFVAVELSSVYHDLVKDRLYTESANSLRRRSTQTVLWRLVTGLCQMTAPIMSFTAEEAWEHIPGKPTESVFLSDWKSKPFIQNETEKNVWMALFQTREKVLPELEKARQAKTIGKALEARVKLGCPGELLTQIEGQVDTLRELLNVSQLELVASASDAIQTEVVPASGTKCIRCWHYETDTGINPEHPALCSRCVKAVTPV